MAGGAIFGEEVRINAAERLRNKVFFCAAGGHPLQKYAVMTSMASNAAGGTVTRRRRVG
jgi:hypothetical protein